MKTPHLFVGTIPITIAGTGDHIGVRAFGGTYVFADSPLAKRLAGWALQFHADASTDTRLKVALIWQLVDNALRHAPEDGGTFLKQEANLLDHRVGLNGALVEAATELGRVAGWRLFDPSVWFRRTTLATTADHSTE